MISVARSITKSLTCGQYKSSTWVASCGNRATYVYADFAWEDDTSIYSFSSALYCNIHRGGNERAKYSKKNLIPIDSKIGFRKAYDRAWAIHDADQRAENEKKAADRHESAKGWKKQQWTDSEVQYEIEYVESKRYDGTLDKKMFVVHPVGAEQYDWGEFRDQIAVLIIDDSIEYDDISEPAAFKVQMSTGGNVYPNAAFAIAKAFLRAGAMVKEINEQREVGV